MIQIGRNWMRGVRLIVYLLRSAASAHDPIFGIGPHVLFKDGFEAAPQTHVKKARDEQVICFF